jgi:hypothetical protein
LMYAKWLNYSNRATAIQGDGTHREEALNPAWRADDGMVPTSRIVSVVGVVIWGVLVGCIGCSQTDPQLGVAARIQDPPRQGTVVGRGEIDELLTALGRLRTIAQEGIDAAAAIGTSDHELAAARQAWRVAEQSWQEGHRAYEAGQDQESGGQLQTAALGFRHAEEDAIRAGLSHIEQELAQTYTHLLASEAQRVSMRRGSVRVVEAAVNLRNGAGLTYPVVGKARIGQILQILAEEGSWYRVRTEQGAVGWVSKELVARVH